MCPRKVDVQRERTMEFFVTASFTAPGVGGWGSQTVCWSDPACWDPHLTGQSSSGYCPYLLPAWSLERVKNKQQKQIPHYFSRWFYITKYQTTKLFWFFVCFSVVDMTYRSMFYTNCSISLTFHHLHILQGKFPQKLVFTWSINHAGSRVSEEGWREKQERCNWEKKVNIWCTYCLTPGGSMV